jgi:hypothetical protein
LSVLESGNDDFLLIGGDLNARIGDWCFDVQDDLEEESVHIFERKSKDNVINNFGKLLVQLCYMFDVVPLNGLVDQELDDNFTFFSERGNSTIDFFLSSVDFLSHVDFFVPCLFFVSGREGGVATYACPSRGACCPRNT